MGGRSGFLEWRVGTAQKAKDVMIHDQRKAS